MRGYRGPAVRLGILSISAGILGFVLGWYLLVSLNSSRAAQSKTVAEGGLTSAQSLQLNLELGASLERSNHLQDAIAQYERAQAVAPNNPVPARRLAILYSRTANHEKADLNFQKLAKLQPKDAGVYNDWGHALYLRNNWPESERKLRQSLQLDPKHQRALSNLGLVLGQQDRYQEAFQTFRSSGLTKAQAHCNMGFILWSKGKLDEARRACQTAKQIDPACRQADTLLVQIEALQNAKPGQAPNPAARKGSTRTVMNLPPSPTVSSGPQMTPSSPKMAPSAPQMANAEQPVHKTSGGVSWYRR